MKEAKAFAPCHITGFFQILDQPANPLYAGSRGAGVSLSQGVETTVRVRKAVKGSLQVRINGFGSNSVEVSKHVVDAFLSRFKQMENFEIIVEHHVEVPIRAGFGTSGAGALSLALALNDVFGLDMSKIETAQIAHVTEVECKTGLGTVIAEAFGGVEVRVKPGAPGIGEIKHVPVTKDYVMTCQTFNSLSTRKFLTDEKTRKRINEFGGKLVDKLIEEPNVTNFMNFSRQFAEHVGLITEKIRRILNAADNANFICSMPMFGESVFTLIKQESLKELLKIFREHGPDRRIIVCEIDFEGARLLK
ncbi:MAG: pantoate kinase [Candidatus Bathyarchaeota archaeon]|nr:pantoate kinase [Candidatus Bathyarchaeota archaeon]